MEYLHANGIVHGDIKINNILVSDGGDAKITDFGIARILDVSGYTTMTYRNVRYAAPELRPINITDEDMMEVRPTTASDIFSLGILFLQLFHGPDKDKQRELPYNHIRYRPHNGDIVLLLRIHERDRPRRERYNFILDQHWMLVERCWAHDPLDRPTITEVSRGL